MIKRNKGETYYKTQCPICEEIIDTATMEYGFINFQGKHRFCHKNCEEVYFELTFKKN